MTTKTTQTTIEKVHAALLANPGNTAADLATITGLGRSTVTKQLATLERTGQATRSAGNRHGGRRLPDRWSTAHPPGDPSGRLRPGQLNQLVLTHITDHPDAARHTPITVAKALGRSSGAVANCLARLTATGQLRQTSNKPRRYDLPRRS